MLFVEILSKGSREGLEQELAIAFVEGWRVVDLSEKVLERTQHRLAGEHAEFGASDEPERGGVIVIVVTVCSRLNQSR